MVRPLVCPTGGLGSIPFAECCIGPLFQLECRQVGDPTVGSICVMTATEFGYQSFQLDINK